MLSQVDASRKSFAQELGRDLLPSATDIEVDRFARVACLSLIGFQQAGQQSSDLFIEMIKDILDLAGVKSDVEVIASRVLGQRDHGQGR